MRKTLEHLVFLVLTLTSTTLASAQGHWRIMPFGNSITVGFHGSDPIGGYRDDLYFLLRDDGFDFNMVGSHRDGNSSVFDIDHQGTGGIRADEIIHELDLLPQLTPDIIMVHIGTNDISQGQSIASTLSDIEAILDKIFLFDSGIKILLASIIPRSDGRAALTAELNDGIKAMVPVKAGEGIEVTYVPINEAFAAHSNWESDLMNDAVHPNNAGYQVMAEKWFEALYAIMRPGSPPPDPTPEPPPPDLPGSLQLAGGNGQSGQLGSILTAPLRVRLLDSDENPVANAEVVFTPVSGSGTILPDTTGALQAIEAEAGQMTAPMQVFDDGDAVGGSYAASTERQNGALVLSFRINREADYWFWGRVFSPSGVGDSFFFNVSSTPDTLLWDTDNQYNAWYWQRLEDRHAGPVSYRLVPGTYELTILSREPDARLDRILISDNGGFEPQGSMGFGNPRTDDAGFASAFWRLGPELGAQQVRTSSALAATTVLFTATAFNGNTIAISGGVQYYGSGQPIAGLGVILNSDSTVLTDGTGQFEFSDLTPGGAYDIKPRADLYNGADSPIISYDAALAARYAIGIGQLDPTQALAADVNEDGHVQMYDAALIARYAVGMDPLFGSVVGKWTFTPDSLRYSGPNNNISDANFVGILRGDVNSSWAPSNPGKVSSLHFTDILTRTHYWIGDTLAFRIPLEAADGLVSFDLSLRHDSQDFSLAEIDFGTLDRSFTTFSNEQDNLLRLGGFTTRDGHAGSFVLIKYRSRSGRGRITLENYRINNDPARKSAFYLDAAADKHDLSTFELLPNYPNPVRDFTHISFNLTEAGQITLRLFNLLGQEVWQRQETLQSPGLHTLYLDARDTAGRPLQSGLYLLLLQDSHGRSKTQKLKIIK